MPKTLPPMRHPLPPVEALHRLQHTHQAVLEQIEADRDKAVALAKEKQGNKIAKAHAETAISHLMHGEIIEALIGFLVNHFNFGGENGKAQNRVPEALMGTNRS
jgi:hypothetical protein